MAKKYKYNSAYEWLAQKVHTMSADELKSALLQFALKAGNDDIQDLFQSDMETEGFFEPEVSSEVIDEWDADQCREYIADNIEQPEDHDDAPLHELRALCKTVLIHRQLKA